MGIRLKDSGRGTATVSCGGCGEVIYPDCRVLANHVITNRPDGRVHLWSRDFGLSVHLCEIPAAALALEQVSGLILDILASYGAIPAR